MPRQSPYVVELTPQEREVLLMTSRKYTSPYFDVVRAKIILMAADGFENEQVGLRLDLPRQIVSKWRKRFFERRLDGLENLSRPGRPPGFPP